MEASTVLYCFQLDGNPVTDQDAWEKIQTLPYQSLSGVSTCTCIDVNNGDKMLVATNSNGGHCVLHVYQHGLVTIDVQQVTNPPPSKTLLSTFSFESSKALEEKIRAMFKDKCKYTRSIPSALRRGYTSPYFIHGDYSLYEHKPVQLVVEVQSRWQNIKVYRSPEYGHILCLDDDIMIAESDDIYTKTLLGVDRNDFTDKTVLILGGGDGGLLHELRQMAPRHVLMVEIDPEVLTVCRQYLQGVCGSSLSEMEGHNFQIRIDDCVNVLHECLEEKRKFDYVINDLSEYLINTDTQYKYDFLTSSRILEWSMALLGQGGKYLSRGDAVKSTTSISSFEEDIKTNGLHSKRFIIDVPSFREQYCLFEVWKPVDQNGVDPI